MPGPAVLDDLLISGPNGGGLFWTLRGTFVRIGRGDFTGLALSGNRIAFGQAPDTVWIRSWDGPRTASRSFVCEDVHDVHPFDDAVIAVATARNALLRIDPSGEASIHRQFPGEQDALHLNCLCRWNGRLLCSAFGDFRDAKGYRDRTEGAGFIFDVESGERVVGGLSQPHSPVPLSKDRLLVCNSSFEELVEIDAGWRILRTVRLGGYTRGICVRGGTALVGVSRERHPERPDSGTGCIACVDLATFEVVARTRVPFPEIYSIASLPNDHLARRRVLESIRLRD